MPPDASLKSKRRIALAGTALIALLLLAGLVVRYTHPFSSSKKTEATSKILDFYATIKDFAQSSFGSK